MGLSRSRFASALLVSTQANPHHLPTSSAALPCVHCVCGVPCARVRVEQGLGGMTGAALLGRADFVAAASPWRRRLGGNPFTSMPFALSCRAAYETHAGSFEARWHKLRTLAPQLSRTAASHGGSLRFVPAEPQCCQAHCYIRGSAEQLDAARDEVLAELDIKLYNKLRACGVGPGKDECYFEITVGPNNIEIPDDVFVHAWSCFFEALQKAESS
uniref:Uncharacterized protein n=1 Tax=Chrysotila carterae TaxID=13221 RepID=A0A7S4AYD4_CHRCT